MSLTPREVVKMKEMDENMELLMMADATGVLDQDEVFVLLEMLLTEKGDVEDMPDNHVFEPPEPRKYKTIDSFVESDIPHLFRFKTKDQLRRLLAVMKLPDVIRLENGALVSNEELMLVGLYRLAYPCRLISIAREFGGETTLWGSHTYVSYQTHL